ncbi:hypothetical protein E5S67_05483 [Microcoleus sp. IPMA8]|uniref:Uncharacterized protein n=1 Tax=Microcoleus asticus IPMA8 TaxID=2563858 RepID=A0ABX2D7B3_9CYAN|nr:hypothetical protein [Microcoleus asticus IPMA8]
MYIEKQSIIVSEKLETVTCLNKNDYLRVFSDSGIIKSD